jgi:hypothetical protein
MEVFMPGHTLLILGAALGLLGCNSVSVSVDGSSAEGVQSAFFIEEDGAYGSDGLIQIYLVSFSDACTAYEGFQDEVNDLDWLNFDLLDDIEDIWTEYYPETFEETIIKIRVDDPDDSVAGLDFKGVDWNDGLSDDDEAKATFTRYKQALDDDYWQAWAFGGETDEYVESWVSDDGDLSVAGHTENTSIRGSFVTTLADADDGDDEGDVTFRFNADRCREYESELW